MNSKYFTAEKIFARLGKSYKKKMQGITIGTIIEWCSEIEIEVLGNYHQFVQYDHVELEVVDQKVLLPCFLYRILNVYTSGNVRIMNYYNNGAYLSMPEYGITVTNGSKIYIDFLGIAVDPETEYPLLLRGHEQACFWGCVVKLHEEDFSLGKMRGDSFSYITDRYEIALRSADTGFRHVSRNDQKEYLAVVLNAIQKPNRTPFSL